MNIIISNSSQTPIYEQVKEQIENQIITNELKIGEKLPSIRVLAKDLGISVITTKNAYDELEKEGYIETFPSKGSFVSNKNKEWIKEEQVKKIENCFLSAISISKISNISKEELKKILDILLEEDE